MSDHPNLDLIKRGYAAYASGDTDTLDELFDEDVIWHVGGQNPLSGDYKGKAQVFSFFGKLQEMSGGTATLAVHDLLANDQHGVAIVTASATRNGQSFSGDAVHTMRIVNGRVTEFWEYVMDQPEQDRFWS
ncbi:MAG TPA: nuclear transport factor 2 family protein [Mycobacteriales bacterium]|jgi:ketosteroid isomerase-like protein|nr:nuclear transport factor 2 family protein [Mycobacteriales bacterium]